MIASHQSNAPSFENKFIQDSSGKNWRREYMRNQSQSRLKRAKTRFAHMKIAERICHNIGFDIHLNSGHLILREFLLFCFPNGIKRLITKSQLKYLNLKLLVPYLEEIEKKYPKTFNSEKFKPFLRK
jgi:hypothetical protein